MTDPTSTPPWRVVGRYALYGEIAAGGMGVVHYGRLIGQAGFSRTVAVKRLHDGLAGERQFVAMMIDEARLVERVRHPNVVPTLDVVTDGDELFVVMEYVHGESLATLQRLAKQARSKIPIDVGTAMVTAVLHGLHAAHTARSERGAHLGIVHRDVSPQNILVGVDGIARIADFGIAKAASRAQVTRQGERKGKLPYMAPEQFENVPVTPLVDVYASAVVLWETLTGERLLQIGSDASIMRQILAAKFPSPRDVNRDVSPELSAIVMKGLASSCKERHQSAYDFAIALEGAVRMPPTHEVGAWVGEIAADSLDLRADELEEIEPMSNLLPDAMARRRASVRSLVVTLPSLLGPQASPPPEGAPAPPLLPVEATKASAHELEATAPDVRPSPTPSIPGHPARARRRAPLWIAGGVALSLSVLCVLLLRRPAVEVPARAPRNPSAVPDELPRGEGPITNAAPAFEPPPLAAPSSSSSSSSSSKAASKRPLNSGRAPTAPKTATTDDCTVPFTVDESGVQVPKRACLRR